MATPWVNQEATRTEIEVVRPPEEIVKPAGPPGIICPACRTENEATRRFCKSCGSPLVAPEVVKVERPVRRRSMRWLVILVVVVALAFAGSLGAAILLKGGLPGATNPPAAGSNAPGSTTKPGATSTAPGASGGLSGHPLAVASVKGNGRRSAATTWDNVVDGNRLTTWQAESKAPHQPWLTFTFDAPVDISSITIAGGDESSDNAYQSLRRPRQITVSVDGADPVTLALSDVNAPQTVPFTAKVKQTIKIFVVDTYPATRKTGSTLLTWCAIGEITFGGTKAP